MYPIFGAVLIYTNQEKLKFGKVPTQLKPFLEGLNTDNIHSLMYNIYFLIRRAMTAVILVTA